MVHTLSDSGANSIWEHSLLDPSNSKISRRKPQPKDPLQLVIGYMWQTIFVGSILLQSTYNFYSQTLFDNC